MIKVTWEWLGMPPALDLANTVTIEDGHEHDLIGTTEDYEGWARLEGTFLPEPLVPSLQRDRAKLMELRRDVRRSLSSLAAGERPPRSVVDELNRLSRSYPEWSELDDAMSLRVRGSGTATERLLAHYARSAMGLIAGESDRLRRCPAPSCGMFYLSSRAAQRWCSVQCGTRARVARYHQSRRSAAH